MNAVHASAMAYESKTYQQVAAFLQQFPAPTPTPLPTVKDVGLSGNLLKYNTENASSLYRDSLQGLRVLIADNNEITQMVAERLLTDCQAQVYVTAKGSEALSTCLSIEIEVIITGIELEDMSGEELLAEVRAKVGNLPVLILDSCGKDYGEVRSLGFKDAINMPIEKTELYQKVSLSTLD